MEEKKDEDRIPSRTSGLKELRKKLAEQAVCKPGWQKKRDAMLGKSNTVEVNREDNSDEPR